MFKFGDRVRVIEGEHTGREGFFIKEWKITYNDIEPFYVMIDNVGDFYVSAIEPIQRNLPKEMNEALEDKTKVYEFNTMLHLSKIFVEEKYMKRNEQLGVCFAILATLGITSEKFAQVVKDWKEEDV